MPCMVDSQKHLLGLCVGTQVLAETIQADAFAREYQFVMRNRMDRRGLLIGMAFKIRNRMDRRGLLIGMAFKTADAEKIHHASAEGKQNRREEKIHREAKSHSSA